MQMASALPPAPAVSSAAMASPQLAAGQPGQMQGQVPLSQLVAMQLANPMPQRLTSTSPATQQGQLPLQPVGGQMLQQPQSPQFGRSMLPGAPTGFPTSSVVPLSGRIESSLKDNVPLSGDEILSELYQMERQYGQAQLSMEALRAQLLRIGVRPCV